MNFVDIGFIILLQVVDVPGLDKINITLQKLYKEKNPKEMNYIIWVANSDQQNGKLIYTSFAHFQRSKKLIYLTYFFYTSLRSYNYMYMLLKQRITLFITLAHLLIFILTRN